MLHGLELAVERLTRESERATAAHGKALAQFADASRSLQTARSKLFDSTSGLEGKRALLAQQLRALSRLPKVTRVSVGGDESIVVFTSTLTAFDSRSGLTHEIGEFKIQFFPKKARSADRVKWTNLTRTVTIGERKMYAPHIHASGTPCWGGFAHSLPDAVAAYRISDAIIMAIAMVERVNVEDYYGKGVTHWPAVTQRSY